ncbi:hypothetical protein [Nitratireductor sp. L15S-10]|uniref:hypothetical protein n=1 Tax=Nitratireductor sp. L15S-10 TaxID=3034028 RepID=UPI003857C4D7
MGLTLSSMTREVEDARAIRESLAKGERIVEVDPELIDPSLVRDRLSREDDGDEDFNALVESVRGKRPAGAGSSAPSPDRNGTFPGGLWPSARSGCRAPQASGSGHRAHAQR